MVGKIEGPTLDETIKKRNQPEVVLKVVSWNARSLNNTSKVIQIEQEKADLMMIQEVWNPREEILELITGTKDIKKRKDGYGGTMLIWKEEQMTKIREPVEINQDSQISKFTIANNRYVWIGSVYLHKKSKKEMKETLTEIQKQVPQTEWSYILLGGDWNIDIYDKKDKAAQTLREICKQMNLRICENGPTREDKVLDYFLTGNGIEVQKVTKTKSNSDHMKVQMEIRVKKPDVTTKKMRIPNKKLANDITQQALDQATESQSFLEQIHSKLKKRKYDITKEIKIKPWKKELLERVMQIENQDEDIENIIQNFWREKVQENEQKRYSPEIEEAFNFLKKVYKYHEYDKKDGSIVNKIKLDDGTIITDQEEVNHIIIEELKKQQVVENEPQYDNPIDFPKLPPLNESEMMEIVGRLSTNKAIAYDGITDILFTKENEAKTINILKDIWSMDWNKIEDHLIHFRTRLIPLNKIHPQIPTKEKFRPISISSPIIKLMEARLLPKLNDYMNKKLHVGQTGFVQGMGIAVNQMRIVQRIVERTRSGTKQGTYAIFIDFSNAYNTVLHRKLFKRLKGILTEEEINFLKAIYSRIRISIGNSNFKPNVGVAQGSVISPALFNIYTEELYKVIEDCGVNKLDIMAYADDLVIICDSPTQVRNTINQIKRWSLENNLKLNNLKSGIMQFLPRTGKQTSHWEIGKMIEEIPVVEKYKYLGMWLDQKLTLEPQKKHIETKCNWIAIKLYPLLKNVSLDYRINLWTVLIRPLFEHLLFILYAERSTTNINSIQILIRKTIKKFTLLGKNLENRIIEDLTGFNIMKRAADVVEITKEKWEARKKHFRPIIYKNPANIKKRNRPELLPKEVQEILNMQLMICPKCRGNTICNSKHMKEIHQIMVPTYDELMQMLDERLKNEKRHRKGRVELLKKPGECIKPFIISMKRFCRIDNII